MFVSAGISPHPPLLIEDIGRENILEVSKTKNALENLSEYIVKSKPDLLVITTPHGPVFREGISIFNVDQFIGDFSNFSAPYIKLVQNSNIKISENIINNLKQENLPIINLTKKDMSLYGIKNSLDHATMVPLYYLQKAGLSKEVPLLLISIGFISYKNLFYLGKRIKFYLDKLNIKYSFIASGDLSHKLKEDGPYGLHPSGPLFDKIYVDKLKKLDFQGILNMDKNLISEAGECGFMPILILLGALSEVKQVKSQLLSYEAPFGVGYSVFKFLIKEA